MEKMKEITKIKLIATIIFLASLAGIFILGYLIGFDIGKRNASYALIITIEPAPDEIEPKTSEDRDKI